MYNYLCVNKEVSDIPSCFKTRKNKMNQGHLAVPENKEVFKEWRRMYRRYRNQLEGGLPLATAGSV